MQARMTVRHRMLAVVATLLGAISLFACSSSSSFQPLGYGAKAWSPPAGWDPDVCVTGYYVAIDSCPGCTGYSYALCDGSRFTQCICGGAFWPGATCPQTLDCSSTDFPPPNWTELTDYAGPGWAGLTSSGGEDGGGNKVDSGSD
jgi:hypothetical protein